MPKQHFSGRPVNDIIEQVSLYSQTTEIFVDMGSWRTNLWCDEKNVKNNNNTNTFNIEDQPLSCYL